MTKQLSSKIVYQNPWMTMREDQVEFANGHRGIYGVVDKPDFVLIVPWDGERFHLVDQFRYPIGRVSREFPQGKHEEDPHRDPTILANDELAEEIGLKAGKLQKVGFLYEALGYSSQGFHLYLATQLTPVPSHPDATEANLVHITLSLAELEKQIADGEIFDAPTIAALGLVRTLKIL